MPNTLLIGQGTGEVFNVTAADVVGSITLGANGQSNADYYAITATAGELLNFQVRSQSLTRDGGNAIDSELTIYEADGKTVVPYYGSPSGAFSDDGFQNADAVLYDLTMPYTGTYYVKVSTFAVTDSFGIVHNSDLGSYELFMYSFAATPSGGTASANGDTLVGSSGKDTLIGSSANDLIESVPGDSVVSGSGADTVDTLPYNIADRRPTTSGGKPGRACRQLRCIEPGHVLHIRLARGREQRSGDRRRERDGRGHCRRGDDLVSVHADRRGRLRHHAHDHRRLRRRQPGNARRDGRDNHPFHDPNRDGRQPDHGGLPARPPP